MLIRCKWSPTNSSSALPSNRSQTTPGLVMLLPLCSPPSLSRAAPSHSINVPDAAQSAPGAARGTKTNCALHLAAVLSIELCELPGFCSLLSVAAGIGDAILFWLTCWRYRPSRSRSARDLCLRSNVATFKCSTSQWTCCDIGHCRYGYQCAGYGLMHGILTICQRMLSHVRNIL